MNTLLSSADVIELVNTEYAELGETHHCMLLRRGFNDSYLVGIGRQWYVFRVYLNNKYYIESSDAFQFELDLLDHLNHAGIPVSCAVKRDNQKKLGVAPTPQGDRAFALFTYAKGDQLRKKTATLERCFLIGKTTAELHLAANSFSSEHSRYHLDRKYLVDEPLKTIAQQADEATRTVSERRAKEMEEMVESMQPVEELLEGLFTHSMYQGMSTALFIVICTSAIFTLMVIKSPFLILTTVPMAGVLMSWRLPSFCQIT